MGILNPGAGGIPDFSFPGDILTSLDPMDILEQLGEVVPPPFDMAFQEALKVARFAPLLPMLNALKEGKLEEAASCIMHPDISGPFMKLLAKIDLETPREVLKSVFLNNGVQSTIQQYCASAPKELLAPFQMLQEFGKKLEGEMEDVLQDLSEMIKEMKVLLLPENLALTDFRFPQV
jgi:hypothetical protein